MPGQKAADGAAHQHVLLEVQLQAQIVEDQLQQLLKAARLYADVQQLLAQAFYVPAVDLGQRGYVLAGLRVGGDVHLRAYLRQPAQRVQVGLHVVDKGHAVLGERLRAGHAVGDERRAVGQEVARHVEEVPGQGQHLDAGGEALVRHVQAVAGLSHQELVPQLLWRIAAVQKARLQHRRARELRLDAGGKDLAAGLPLQILAAAYVVGVRVRHQYAAQRPAVLVEHLAHPAPGVLVPAGVYEVHPVPGVVDAYLGGTVYVVGLIADFDKLVHAAPSRRILIYPNSNRFRGRFLWTSPKKAPPKSDYPKNLLCIAWTAWSA